MARNSNCGLLAMTALLFVGFLSTASAGQIRFPSLFRRSLLSYPPAPASTQSETYKATDSPATLSGLQDAPSTGTSAVKIGHYLTGAGVLASTAYNGDISQFGGQKGPLLNGSIGTTGTWGQQIFYSAINVNGNTAPDIFEDLVLGGVTLDSAKFNQQNTVWMVDTGAGTAYKIDSSSSASHTGAVTGVYKTGPGTAAQPVLVAVDSQGNAWVANLNTLGANGTVGSVVKIKNVCTGTPGTAYSSGPTSKSWASGNTSPDSCVVKFIALTDTNIGITALAIDGADNLWVLATTGISYTGSVNPNALSVFKVSSTGDTAVLMYGPLAIPGGSFGAPGGSGAVVDKAGFLWTGNGPFQYGADSTYSVLRFDTGIDTLNNAAFTIRAFPIPDEANMLNLDADSNLWVAGNAFVTKVFTSNVIDATGTISATLGGSATSIILSSSALSVPISLNLTSHLDGSVCTDPTDGCCTSGSFNSGIAITRDVLSNGAPSSLNTIYVANNCPTGLVVSISNAAGIASPTVTSIIPAGSTLQAIAADRTSNIWVAGSIITDAGFINTMYLITKGTTVANLVSLTLAPGAQILSGSGDLTGYITAQPTASAIYTYMHDTGIPSYSKWVGGSIGWAFDNYGTTNGQVGGTPMYAVTAQVGNDLTALQSAANPLTFVPSATEATIPAGTGNGRYLRVDVKLTRFGKVGPQDYGKIPTLTELRVKAYNNDPSAKCKSVYVSATDDTIEIGGVGVGLYANAVAGVCTQGPPITIDNGSFDPDTQDNDALITTSTEIWYGSARTKYTNSLPTWALEKIYGPSMLTVYDYHGSHATCTSTVAIWDDTAPTYIPSATADSGEAPALCVWPPNGKYWCLLDIFAQSGGRFLRTNLLPIRDNCAAVDGFPMTVNAIRSTAGATPAGVGANDPGFSCTDTDPRSRQGDCTITTSGSKVNFCVKAIRRTTFTNLDRVFTMKFLVQDAGTQQGLNVGTLFSRSLRLPPIWIFKVAATCPRATYAAVTTATDCSSGIASTCAAIGASLGTGCHWSGATCSAAITCADGSGTNAATCAAIGTSTNLLCVFTSGAASTCSIATPSN